MTKKILNLIRKNWQLKVISLMFAIGLWAFVTVGQEDIEVPFKVDLLMVIPNNLVRTNDIISQLDITVTGPKNLMRAIDPGDLKYTIEVQNSGESLIKIIDSRIKGLPSGVRVTKLEPTQVRIVAEERVDRKVPVSVTTRGRVPDGYAVIEKTVEPVLVEVTGALNEVSRLVSVNTEPVDVSGKKDTFVSKVGLDLAGQHINLVKAKEVTVKIIIEEKNLTRHFKSIPIEVVNSEYASSCKPTDLSFDLEGPEITMSKLTKKDVRLVIDAGGLEPGAYDLRPRIQLADPDFVLRADLPEVNVTIKPGKKKKDSDKKSKK